MSFIKVTILVPLDKNAPIGAPRRQTTRYINSDYVVSVNTHSGEVLLASQHSVTITQESAAYFLTCVDVHDALVTEAPPAPSLKTRIAQALRNQFPNGASVAQLYSAFHPIDLALNDYSLTDIIRALDELTTERVVIRSLIDGVACFRHAANAIQSPDPAAPTADLDSAPLADNER